MTEELISVKDFAGQNGLHKQTVFKVLRRLEIEPAKSRGGSENRGQMLSYITKADAQRVLEALASRTSTPSESAGEDVEVTDGAL